MRNRACVRFQTVQQGARIAHPNTPHKMARAFISYSREDMSAAQLIHSKLEADGIQCWRDERWISAGDDFAEDITRAIRDSDLFIVLISAKSSASEWVAIEVALARHFGKRITPILLDHAKIGDKILPYVVRPSRLDFSLGPLDQHLPALVGHLQAALQGTSPGLVPIPVATQAPVLWEAVTNAQYLSFLRETRQHGLPSHWSSAPPHFSERDAGQPVRWTTWDEAVAFCDWMGGSLPGIAAPVGYSQSVPHDGTTTAEWIEAGTDTHKQVRHSRSWEIVCLLDRRERRRDVTFRCLPLAAAPAPDAVLLDGGTFTLGTRPELSAPLISEYAPPMNLVQPILSRAARSYVLREFWLSKECTTNRQYWDFVNRTGYTPWPRGWDDKYRAKFGMPFPPRLASYPVVHVSGRDAREYCRWSRTRLPKHLEWERASSAPRSLYPWGPTYDPLRCNSVEGARGQVGSVQEYETGDAPGGVRQLAGNTFEWTTGPTGDYEIRGGSFKVPCEFWGASFAFQPRPQDYASDDVSFRVVYPQGPTPAHAEGQRT